jgi:hypothetical protein
MTTHKLRERICLDPSSNKKDRDTLVGLATYLLNGRVNTMICFEITPSLKEKVSNNRTRSDETVPTRLNESRSLGTVPLKHIIDVFQRRGHWGKRSPELLRETRAWKDLTK